MRLRSLHLRRLQLSGEVDAITLWKKEAYGQKEAQEKR